ncbi:MAG TPA: hypothetical protein VE991_12820 [Acidimicrobiales bacterium]|nr:hypothetical protein [Acidimicrobiales bacterium]
MRKFLTGSLLVASIGGGVALTSASAFASGVPSECGAAPVGGSVSQDGSGVVQACPSTPAETGTVTLYGSAASQSGYIIAQGNGGAITGYAGVSSVDGGIVGCGNGAAYDTSGGNNVILSTPSQSNPSGYPSQLQSNLTALQGAQGNPCTPAA